MAPCATLDGGAPLPARISRIRARRCSSGWPGSFPALGRCGSSRRGCSRTGPPVLRGRRSRRRGPNRLRRTSGRSRPRSARRRSNEARWTAPLPTYGTARGPPPGRRRCPSTHCRRGRPSTRSVGQVAPVRTVVDSELGDAAERRRVHPHQEAAVGAVGVGLADLRAEGHRSRRPPHRSEPAGSWWVCTIRRARSGSGAPPRLLGALLDSRVDLRRPGLERGGKGVVAIGLPGGPGEHELHAGTAHPVEVQIGVTAVGADPSARVAGIGGRGRRMSPLAARDRVRGCR